jgi:hypothetical protein
MSHGQVRLFSYWFENLKGYIEYVSKNNFSLLRQEKCECLCVTTIHHIIKEAKNYYELSYNIRLILDFEKNKRTCHNMSCADLQKFPSIKWEDDATGRWI